MKEILYTILCFIKRNSLIIFLILNSLKANCQDVSNDKVIINIFHLLPDEIFTNRYSELQNPERKLIWDLYNSGEYKVDINSTFDDYNALKLDFINAPNLSNIYFLINYEDNIIIIFDNRNDIGLEYEIKLFQNVVAFRVQYSTHLTTEPGRIEFYSYKSNKIKNITPKVLNSFNYRKDNYSKSTIDSMEKFYSCSFTKEDANKMLLYNFLESDTVEIVENFILHSENGYNNTGLDEKYFDGGFFSRKYIMKNGKLRLAE